MQSTLSPQYRRIRIISKVNSLYLVFICLLEHNMQYCISAIRLFADSACQGTCPPISGGFSDFRGAVSRSVPSQTGPADRKLRFLHDQPSGLCARVCATRLARLASVARSCPSWCESGVTKRTEQRSRRQLYQLARDFTESLCICSRGKILGRPVSADLAGWKAGIAVELLAASAAVRSATPCLAAAITCTLIETAEGDGPQPWRGNA